MFEEIYVVVKGMFSRYNVYKPHFRIMKVLTTYYSICAQMEVGKKPVCGTSKETF